METEKTKEIYSKLDIVWPQDNIWYTYLHNKIINYVQEKLISRLSAKDFYLNAGSGGSTYDLAGTCYHVDIAENLIRELPNSFVASIEKMPFQNDFFDAIICVGSVINYCSAFESILEFSRIIKKDGILILEFERSQSAELWFSHNWSQQATLQNYNYLNNIHTLWLYSESYICSILKQAGFKVLDKKRIHSISAIINKITCNENFAGRFGHLDTFFSH